MIQAIKKNFQWCFLGLLFAISLFVWYAVFAESQRDLIIAFLDVGQGDATLIGAAGGQQILIDGGPNKKVLSELGKVMPFYDRNIDAVIATHPDKDHIAGLIDVLKRYDVGMVIEPEVKSEIAAYKSFENAIKEKGIKKIFAKRGMKIMLSHGAYLQILFPPGETTNWETNDASIVAKLVYGDTSFLLTGDSPRKIEKYLASIDGDNLDVDVLKAGHHGSRTSSSDEFISHASPEYAVISAGKNNRYGHPHKEVIDALEKFGVKILRTDLLGSIIMESDGENILLKKQKPLFCPFC